ncbi:unnamed protein product [Bursaphelenchus xylophilus]|uniref:(pine wood nematode) hypothetical protein n=1 Tax=Bursaphelenchus xylophilus TaxID=6326 RepID=A0A1I7SDH9_BURXY|nr:unnamed protein product [Bursaphelenchus xylophilus]CAG9131656.1 unnamed protein product [Bursaphelenchus xylophilus]
MSMNYMHPAADVRPQRRLGTVKEVIDSSGDYKCCCDMFDVHFGTFVIGHLGMASSIIEAFIVSTVHEHDYAPSLCIVFIITTVSYLALMISNRLKKRKIYVIHMIANCFLIMMTYMLGFAFIKKSVYDLRRSHEIDFSFQSLAVGVSAVIASTVYTYFWIIVYWDYNYLGQWRRLERRQEFVKHVFVLF